MTIKTTKEKIEELLNSTDTLIKEKAEKDIEICKSCPDYEHCIDCDDSPWNWWDHMTLNIAKPKPVEEDDANVSN